MKLLLDTHVLLWWQADDRQLGPGARVAIGQAETVLVSDASIWEIAVKVRVGKLRVDLADVRAAMRDDGFERLPITAAHLDRLMTLPQLHRDPFDHLLIAQAVADSATLLTADRAIAGYPVTTIGCA